MELINSIADAKRLIESFDGSPEEFLLPVSDELQDNFGLNMAVITDHVLAKGWEPDGFEQRQGFRLYRYKALD